MAIRAVTSIVRKMSLPETDDSQPIANQTEGTALERDRPLRIDRTMDSSDANAEPANESVEPIAHSGCAAANDQCSFSSDQQVVSAGSNSLHSAIASPASQSKPSPWAGNRATVVDHGETTDCPFDVQHEMAFQFHEIDQNRPLSAVGNTPTTESLEIELGTVQMSRDEVSQLGNGVVVALRESVDEEVLIRHSDRIVARGKMAIVDGKIAVRINEVLE